MKTRPAKLIVHDAKQVRALSGPVQHQLIATLERVGASTAKELAVHLGIPAGSLYYHLRKLRAVGLLVVTDQRPTSRRPETVFGLPGRELVFDPRNRNPSFVAALAGMQRSLLTMATRLYERALRRPVSVRYGARRNLCVIQQNARLRPRDLAELNRRLEAVAEFMAQRDDPEADPFVSLTISMSPLTHDRP